MEDTFGKPPALAASPPNHGYITFEELTSLRRRRNSIRKQLQEEPDRALPRSVLQELHGINARLNCELVGQVNLLSRISDRQQLQLPSRRSNGQLLQRMTARALTRSLHRHQMRGGRSAYEVGFIAVETPLYSGLDMVGADFLLIDRRSGKFLMLDVTCMPVPRGLPRLRKAGIIDCSDFSEWMRHHHDAEDYARRRVNERLHKLLQAVATSPLDLLSLRLPLVRSHAFDIDIVPTPELRREWLENLSACRDDLALFVSDLISLSRELQGEQQNAVIELAQYTQRHESGALRFVNSRMWNLKRLQQSE